MPRCRPGLVPVYHGSPRCGHGAPTVQWVLPGVATVLPGVATVLPGVATVLPGLVSVCPGRLGLYSVLMFYVSHQEQGGVIRIGWFRSVPEIK